MSSTTRILLSLVLGLAVGVMIAAADSAALERVVPLVTPLGKLWVRALQMTVIPLVFAVLVTGVVSAASAAAAGRLAARAIALFIVFLVIAALGSVTLSSSILAAWPVSEAASAAMRAGAAQLGAELPDIPPFSEWIVSVIPTNPIGAAAGGEFLPMIVFALFFAFAAARISTESRDRLVGFFQAVSEAMIVIVNWVLWAAPIGVFALALSVGYHGGASAAGALLYYILLLSGLCLLTALAMYPIAVLRGGVTLHQFATAAARPQVVAASTQSSLATLPAMIEATRSRLNVPPQVVGVVLPLAVSVFRITSPVANLGIVVLIAAIYGVSLEPWQLVAGAGVAVIASFGTVGISSQVGYFVSVMPTALVMGVPVEVLPLFLAVEVIPDIFRTIGNVTADIAVTTVLRRRAP
jgi:Na+/H+-dicarboxylate symporter